MKLKDLRGILICNVMLATMNENGEENYLCISHDFDNEEISDDLLEMTVSNIYSFYDEEEKEHYTVIWIE